MTTDKLNRFWLLATFILIIIILVSSLKIWSHQDQGQVIEISTPSSVPLQGEVYIQGDVANPGLYPVKAADSLESLIQDSGGAGVNADLSHVRLYIPRAGEDLQSQKIDINRADAWLLQALPGIGEVRSQAIIDYRRQNGPFRNIEDLTKVPGISDSIFEKIKDSIVVAE
jgi:competence protein ComEA